MRFVFFFGGVFLCGLAAPAAVAQPLDNVLAQLEQVNPALKAASERLVAEKERLIQARAAFLPNVAATAQTGVQNGLESDKYRGGSITLSQPLYAGGRDTAAYSRIKANILAAQSTYSNTIQTQKIATINAYLTVLAAQSQQAQTAQYVKVLGERLQAEQAKYKSGESTKIDVMQATAFLERGKAEDATAKARLANAQSSLSAQLGGTALESDLVWPDVPAVPATLEAALVAAQQHPRVTAAAADEEAAAATVKGAYGQILPTVTAEASANTYVWSTVPDNQTLGVKLSVPLFAGGGNFSQIRQAKNLQLAADYTLASVRQAVENEAAAAYHNFTASAQNLKALTAAAAAQKEATNGIKARQIEGEASLLDALEAEQDYLTTQTAATEAKWQHVLNAYSLLAAVGNL